MTTNTNTQVGVGTVETEEDTDLADRDHDIIKIAENQIDQMTFAELKALVNTSEARFNDNFRTYRNNGQNSVTDLQESLFRLREIVLPILREKLRRNLARQNSAKAQSLARLNLPKNLTVPLACTAAFTIFWMTWYIIAGHVPMTESITLYVETIVNLPLTISRWWDLPCITIASLLVMQIFSKYKQLDNKSKVVMVGCQIFGLVCGLAGGTLLGFLASMLEYSQGKDSLSSLHCALYVGLYGSLTLGLWAVFLAGSFHNSLRVSREAILVGGLIISLVTGLVIGLAPLAILWLPCGIALEIVMAQKVKQQIKIG